MKDKVFAGYMARAILFFDRHCLDVRCCPPQDPSNSNMAASIRVCCTLRFAIRGELFSFVVTAQTHRHIIKYIFEYIFIVYKCNCDCSWLLSFIDVRRK